MSPQVARSKLTARPIARNECAPLDDIFVLPVLTQYLVYAPLSNFAALVDRLAVERIRTGLPALSNAEARPLAEIVHTLRFGAAPAPLPRRGRLQPAFLGLLPTRACNLACEYCGFRTADDPQRVMDLSLAREAIAWYLGLVAESGEREAEVHFFGGEPFCAAEVVDFSFHFARLRAAELGCSVRFEAATNGFFDEDRCRWVADSFDSVILSLDGPAAIQDRQRHRKDGRGSFETVARSARILSEGAAELSVRVCVTADTVAQMAEIAAWLCAEYRPVAVCFEPVQPTPESEAAGLTPPDPWAFAASFIQAAWVLEAHGVDTVYAAADITTRQVSFCPVGQDVAIVSPEGAVNACYLLERDWQVKGMDLRLGAFDNGAVSLDEAVIESVRGLNVWNKPSCASCFCKWHCAGGCHVNHAPPAAPGDFDALCVQTRVIALRNVLRALGRDDLTPALLADRAALERAVWQRSDALADLGARP